MQDQNDYIIPDPIDDTIQVLKFCQNKNAMNILAGGGWDSKIRIWDLNYSPQGINCQFNSKLVYTNSFSEPILSLCWQPDSVNLFSGTTDGIISCNDMNNFSSIQVGKHDLGVKELCWLGGPINLLVSGSWDGKLCIWDMKSPNPVATFDTGKKVFSMSSVFPLLIVGLSDRQMCYFNLNKIQQIGFNPEASFESHLKYQTRCVSCFSEGNGYALGSIEGRVAIKYIDMNRNAEVNPETKQMNTVDDFAFRCHRVGDIADVFPVNCIAFNHLYGTFCTGGGDGTWLIWDKNSKSRLKMGHFPVQNNQPKPPITAIDYSLNGDLLAFAGGYDWSKGISGEGSFQPRLGIHYVLDGEKKKK